MGSVSEEFDLEALVSGQERDAFGDGAGLKVWVHRPDGGCCAQPRVCPPAPRRLENPFGDL